MSGPLSIERRGAVDWVTLDRPDRLNALDAALIDALLRYFERLYDDDACRVVVLRGAGRAFCAGADLAGELTRHVTDDGIAASMRVQRNIRNIMLAMRRCPQPIVALLHGAAVGGGFALALASDIRLAAPDTRMNAAFIKIGIGGCDVGVSYFLPRLVGASLAHELMLTGRDLLADRALRLGLVAEVVAREGLEEAAAAYVDAMLATAPMGLALTKEVINVNLDAPGLEAAMALEDRNQVMLSQSADFREGAAAFREKRAPKFTGR
ncbi:MAG: Enoyl-CoA hydratase [Sphingomonas bacterium]|uniref:enoyl-CoA hydratase/isomerase family protein n=1 Tax=Sphingomonas bacterium TaxID=1895847 RepID=UPI002610660F|nr:enoyl-CoA hydratase-related protein [Sphingomonas bacterium]MDB5711261.1 Enoyl-CoA hydratase [Sphingomonas bacterium]